MKVEQDQNLSTDQGAPGATTEPTQTAASHQQRRERGRAARRVAPGTATRGGCRHRIVPTPSTYWRRRPKTGFPTSCRSATRV